MHSTAPVVERAFLVAVQLRGQRGGLDAEASLDELELLAHTAGAEVVGRAVQRMERPHTAFYIGKGKVEEIVMAREETGYTMVVFDDELSPSQQRNLEDTLKVKVLDRTALIIDIFARRAQTNEARLQVELAQLEYLMPRLAGQWSHLERLEGAIGTRGPGETQLETDRRLVRNRITRMKREIDEVRQQRALHRRRRSRQGVQVVALVGYTNAGKSTLLQALSGADVFTEDLLFATLDPMTRRVRMPSGNEVLLTRHGGVHPEAADPAGRVVPRDAGRAGGRGRARPPCRHNARGRRGAVRDGRGDAEGAGAGGQAAGRCLQQGRPDRAFGRHDQHLDGPRGRVAARSTRKRC